MNAEYGFFSPQLYPYESGVPGQFHYFIEYRHRESLHRALRLGLGSSAGLRVYPIQSDPRLVGQFRSCKAYGPSRLPSRGETTATWPSGSGSAGYLHSSTDGAGTKGKHPSEGGYSDFGVVGLTHSIVENRYNHRSLPQLSSMDSLCRRSTQKSPHICRTASSSNTDTDPQQFVDTAVSFSLDSCLVFDVRGREFVYDLAKDPQQDPKVVINLLKQSSSERGSWMVAGAHFRRIGQPRAAIDVMYAMLEGTSRSTTQTIF